MSAFLEYGKTKCKSEKSLWQNSRKRKPKVNVIDIGLRMLNEKRAMIEKLSKGKDIIVDSSGKRDIIYDYSNFGSTVYAPKLRQGCVKDKQNAQLTAIIKESNSQSILQEIESKMPETDFTLPRNLIFDGQSKNIVNLPDKLDQTSATPKEKYSTYAVKIERPEPRAPTPTIEAP